MDKAFFEKHKAEITGIAIKPQYFSLTGTVEEVLDDCILFKTKQKTSYIRFDVIQAVAVAPNPPRERLE
jgi:hypothetical protein